MTSIALCMITRDEAQRLERCLASVRGIVDELVVLDTGSRDGTVELAQRAGARVECAPWNDDFAQARNRALELATCEWALVLDADEVLEPLVGQPGARELLERFAAAHPRALGRVLVRNVDGQSELSRVAIARFLPLRAGARFAGRIHEQAQLGQQRNAPRADTGVVIAHEGYAPGLMQERGKLARNLALLERWTSEAPDDGYAWYQLGRTRSVAAEHRPALEALERALELSRDDESWPIHAVELAARSLHELGHTAQAHELAQRACELAPRRADTLFLRSSLALELGAVREAEAGFRACLELGPQDCALESWSGAHGFAAAHNLGVIAECSQQHGVARRWYERALASEPRHGPSRAGLERVAAALGGLPTSGCIG